MKPDIQKRIQESLATDSPLNTKANTALVQAGYFGLDPESTDTPPPLDTILPAQLTKAVDNLVSAGNFALLSAASSHAPSTKKEKRFKKPYTTEPTRQLSLLKETVFYTRQKIRNLGRNTLARAAFETFRAWRSLRLHLRGAHKGSKGVPVAAKRRVRLGGGTESSLWPIHNVKYRILYLRLLFIIETFYTLIAKKAKKSAIQDRNKYWEAEADSLEIMWKSGRIRDLYQQTRIYVGKRRPVGILFLRDPQGNPLDSPEARMTEWTREFTHRFNPHVPVQYHCTEEESDEEWQDDTRDDDCTSSDPIERARQKARARSQLLPGHKSLLATPSREEVEKGLKTSKLHRSPGEDGITAELIRAALPWLISWVLLIWQWTVACAHVAQSWKDGIIITLSLIHI